MPMQGDGEWTLQVSRRVIDWAEDGGRKEEVGGEPAAMVKDVKVFERSARARHGVSAPVRAGVRARHELRIGDVVRCVYLNAPHAGGMRFAEQYAQVRVMRSGGKTATNTLKKGVSGNG